MWLCHSIRSSDSQESSFVLKTVTHAPSPEASRAGLSSPHCFWESLRRKERSSNLKLGLRGAQAWFRTQPREAQIIEGTPCYCFRGLFQSSSNPGHFFVLFLSISVSFQFCFLNLAVVGESSAWSTPTSSAEASPSSLRSWPGRRRWEKTTLQAPSARVGTPALSPCRSQPRAPSRLLGCRPLLGAVLHHHSGSKPALLRRVAVSWYVPNGSPLWANRDSWPLWHLLISLGR